MNGVEAIETFQCFGSTCTVLVSGDGPAGSARDAALAARAQLLTWHEGFSRFLPDSELSRLNREPGTQVQVSRLMARLAEAVRDAGTLTGGLVDGTLLAQVQDAGYRSDLGEPLDLRRALTLAPARRRARPNSRRGWEQIQYDVATGMLTRPAGLMLDSGGLAKGLFADVLAETLSGHKSFAVNCAGDLTLGGYGDLERPIEVQSPFDGGTIHTFGACHTGVATSGIGRRSWLDDHGAPAHHLLDPSSGRPAFTGIVQVTALAPSALLAEIHAKAALLSGPASARGWLAQGGLVVFDDGSHKVFEPPPVITLRTSTPSVLPVAPQTCGAGAASAA
jgi:thiamine biosynthesis lipoprotein